MKKGIILFIVIYLAVNILSFDIYLEEDKNIISGLIEYKILDKEDISKNINENITRKEVAVLLSRLYSESSVAKYFLSESPYEDVSLENYNLYTPYILYSYKRNWMKGSEYNFRPDDPISYKESNLLMLNILGYYPKWKDVNDLANELGINAIVRIKKKLKEKNFMHRYIIY